MNAKRSIAFLLAIMLIISSFAGCRKINTDGSYLSNTSSDVNVNYSNVEIIDDSSELQNSSETNIDSENVGSSESGVNSDDTQVNNDNNVDAEIDTSSGNVIGGEGSATAPYEGYLSDIGVLVTANIPAGGSKFYSIRGIANRFLTIENPNAYVVFNNNKYSASNGVLKFFLESDAMASDQLVVEIGNTGTVDTSFTLTFFDAEGSADNPIVLNECGKKTITFEKNKKDGINYTYTAVKDGKVRCQVTAIDNAPITTFGGVAIQIFVNRENDVQIVKSSSDDTDVLTDDNGNYLELEVKKGEIIHIEISPQPNARGKYPGVVAEWLLQD